MSKTNAKARRKSQKVQHNTTTEKNKYPKLSHTAIIVTNSDKVDQDLIINKEPFWTKPNFQKKLASVILAIIGITLTVLVMFVGFPHIFSQTKVAQEYNENKKKEQELARQQEEINRKLAEEEPFIKGEKRRVKLETNFGDIILEMREDAAPKNVENFLRLTHRGFYDNTIFHRIVKQENFAVIQGGDPTGTGAGGEVAFGPNAVLPDEIWAVFPQFDFNENDEFTLINEPKLNSDELYKNLNLEDGTVTYPKGLIVMANTGQPDSASSQFFITLRDTILPAQYTAFGVVLPESFGVLDKIFAEVTPITTTPNPELQNIENLGEEKDIPLEIEIEGTDGRPNTEIKLIKARILEQ